MTTTRRVGKNNYECLPKDVSIRIFVMAKWSKIALARNRTGASRVAGEISTTAPPVKGNCYFF